MKLSHFAVAAAAILATAACNADKAGTGNSADSSSAPTVAVTPPADGDWSAMVTGTDAGGFMMGNPNAKVKLIEFGSMTCPHCARFEAAAADPLANNYVKSGKVAFEFRNFVRDPFDVTASLITRCAGAKGFFPLTKAMYADQLTWVGKIQTASPDQQKALAAMQPQQEFKAISDLAGFEQWAAMRGIPAAKVNACLTDQTAIDQLVQMNNDAVQQYQIPGTPTFVLNGKVVDLGTATEDKVWPTLEAKIKEAL